MRRTLNLQYRGSDVCQGCLMIGSQIFDDAGDFPLSNKKPCKQTLTCTPFEPPAQRPLGDASRGRDGRPMILNTNSTSNCLANQAECVNLFARLQPIRTIVTVPVK